MERLGDDDLNSIFMKINSKDDKKSFSQVSKQFLKVASIRLLKLHISFLDLLNDILPVSSKLVSFECSKPLLNTYMKLLADSCPKLKYLNLGIDQMIDPQPGEFEFDFDHDGLYAVANACSNLYKVDLRKKLCVSDVGVASLVRSSKKLAILDLGGCVNVTDESLKAIGESSLGYLSLQGCKLITDLGLKYLAHGDLRYCLDELILAECDKISHDGIIFLKQMVSLTGLSLSKCGVNVTTSGISAISLITNIERLDLSWLINLTDFTLFDIARQSWKLSVINLTGCEGVSSEGLRAFAGHWKLEEVTLFACHNLSWEDMESFALSCVNLKYLGLSRKINEDAHDLYVINNCWIDWE